MTTAAEGSGGGGGDVMLFGVRLNVDPLRKTASMSDLSNYEHVDDLNEKVNEKVVDDVDEKGKRKAVDDLDAGGYVSADEAVIHQSTVGRERKRGVAWTEEEHKLFLLGLEKVGKGDWRGISRNFVKTRTPTQVASHAQKYFIRKNNLNRRRRRSSLFDISTESIAGMTMDEGKGREDNIAPPGLPSTSFTPPEVSNMNNFAVSPYPVRVDPALLPVQAQNAVTIAPSYRGDQPQNMSPMVYCAFPSIAMLPPRAKRYRGSMDQRVEYVPAPTLSLSLSLSPVSSELSQSSRRHSALRATLKDGDSIVSVA